MVLLKHDLKMKMLCQEKHMHSVFQAEIRNLRETNDPDDNTDSKNYISLFKVIGRRAQCTKAPKTLRFNSVEKHSSNANIKIIMHLLCECVRSIINFHPQNQDVDLDMLEMFFSFQRTIYDEKKIRNSPEKDNRSILHYCDTQ